MNLKHLRLFALTLGTLLCGPALTSNSQAEESASYFKNSYQECRKQFLNTFESLHKKNSHIERQQLEVPSKQDQDLFIDVMYIPPASGKKQRLLILTSGVHGIEAFVGSALQNYFLQEDFFGRRDENLGILVVHGINPYGFKHQRRVSEQNVDLNRNFETKSTLFDLKNEGYDKVFDLLNPTEPAATSGFLRWQFYGKALWAIVQNSMESLRRAVLRGQYEHPKGLYFGGQTFEPQRDLLQTTLLHYGDGYQQVLLVDLHTGYGEKGHLHLFSETTPNMDNAYVKKIFEGYELDVGQKKDFYETTGGFVDFSAELFPAAKARFAGMTFEFGTLNSQKTLGSLDSIYRMVLENEDFQYGSKTPDDKKKIATLFHEMFYPSEPRWRKSVQQQFRQTLSKALKNQAALDTQAP